MTLYVGDNHNTYPYTSVAYIEATFPNGLTYFGSGAIVGENDVLTASHAIYSISDGGLAEEVLVYPGLDGGDSPFGSYEVETLDYFEVDVDGDGLLSQSDSEDDLALLGFDETFTDSMEWFNLEPEGTSGEYNLTGYPGLYADASGPRLTNDYGYAVADPNWQVFNFETLEVNPGNSGGPLWYFDEYTASLVGVVSTSGWATDVSSHYETILDWIEGNNDLLEMNTPPVAGDDSAATRANEAVRIDVLANDSDPDGDSLSIESVQGLENGTVVIVEDTSLLFTPDKGFSGETQFSYIMSDREGGTDTGTVTVDVIAEYLLGDCDVNGAVSSSEVQTGVNMFLGLQEVLPCCDQNQDDQVTIVELQSIVNNYLNLDAIYVDLSGEQRTVKENNMLSAEELPVLGTDAGYCADAPGCNAFV